MQTTHRIEHASFTFEISVNWEKAIAPEGPEYDLESWKVYAEPDECGQQFEIDDVFLDGTFVKVRDCMGPKFITLGDYLEAECRKELPN